MRIVFIAYCTKTKIDNFYGIVDFFETIGALMRGMKIIHGLFPHGGNRQAGMEGNAQFESLSKVTHIRAGLKLRELFINAVTPHFIARSHLEHGKQFRDFVRLYVLSAGQICTAFIVSYWGGQ